MISLKPFAGAGITIAAVAAMLAPAAFAATLNPPQNLHAIQSAAECNSLPVLLPVGCGNDITSGVLQLRWEDRDPGITSYNVYRVDGARTLVKTVVPSAVSGQQLVPYAEIAKPPGGYAGGCYAVEALAGRAASQLSASSCYTPAATATSVTLTPTHATTSVLFAVDTEQCAQAPLSGTYYDFADHAYGSAFTSLFPFVTSAGPYDNSKLVAGDTVGYVSAYIDPIAALQTGGRNCAPGTWRGAGAFVKAVAAVAYDLAQLKGHKISSASLSVPISQIVTFKSGTFTASGFWCGTTVGAATTNWFTGSGAQSGLGYDTTTALSINALPLGGIDVTSLVSHWASTGDANDYGFVLSPNLSTILGIAAPPHFPTGGCAMKLGDPKLTVTYF